MIHLNGNIMCAIDCETTGTDPTIHCIWQFSCLPLGFDLYPHKSIPPFNITLQPWNKNRDPRAVNEKKYIHATNYGLEQERAANLFDEWFNRLNLGLKKRIIPLAHNWPFDREFIKFWLTDVGFNYYFDPRYRDTMSLAATLCDICDANADRVPFEAITLHAIATKMGIEWESGMAHDSTYDAYKTIQIYRRLIHCAQFIYH